MPSFRKISRQSPNVVGSGARGPEAIVPGSSPTTSERIRAAHPRGRQQTCQSAALDARQVFADSIQFINVGAVLEQKPRACQLVLQRDAFRRGNKQRRSASRKEAENEIFRLDIAFDQGQHPLCRLPGCWHRGADAPLPQHPAFLAEGRAHTWLRESRPQRYRPRIFSTARPIGAAAFPAPRTHSFPVFFRSNDVPPIRSREPSRFTILRIADSGSTARKAALPDSRGVLAEKTLGFHGIPMENWLMFRKILS